MVLVVRHGWLGAASLLSLVTSCNALWGTDGLSFDTQGAGAATTTTSVSGGGGTGPGGSGGSGGAGATGGTGGCGGCEPPCFPEGLVDDFDAPPIAPTLWQLQGLVSLLSIHDEMLFYEPQPNVNSAQYAGLVTLERYDLRDCATWIMVPQVANHTNGGFTYFEIWNADTAKATLLVLDGIMVYRVYDGPNSHEQYESYQAASHRWWRIRETGDELFLETGPDGKTWTVGYSRPSPAWIDDVKIGFGAEVAANLDQPGATAFDKLDLLP